VIIKVVKKDQFSVDITVVKKAFLGGLSTVVKKLQFLGGYYSG